MSEASGHVNEPSGRLRCLCQHPSRNTVDQFGASMYATKEPAVLHEQRPHRDFPGEREHEDPGRDRDAA